MITLRAEAKVGGERVYVQTVVVDEAWEISAELRENLKRSLRMKLMYEILERWKPVVEVRR